VAAVAVPAWEPNRKHITAPGKRRPFHTFAVRSSSGSPFGAALQARWRATPLADPCSPGGFEAAQGRSNVFQDRVSGLL